VAERVHAAMLRREETGRDRARDAARVQAELDELRVIDDAVLSLGDAGRSAA
jgi:hypothetical protein